MGLTNPFQQNAFGTTNTSLTTKGNINVAQFGDTKVETAKPIVTTTYGGGKLDLPTATFQTTKSQAQKDFETRQTVQKKLNDMSATMNTSDSEMKKQGWWERKTKTQKGLIVGGAIVGVSLLSFLIYKAVKK